ncbi:MAG: hypothetical protein H6553_00670 [Chitinophagales bacterium]|nr:hypothetical protein [Chitinophagales bacterium]
MKLTPILLTLGILFCVSAKAQEEQYNEPNSVYDTLRQEVVNDNPSYYNNNDDNNNNNEKESKNSKVDLCNLYIGGEFSLQFGNYTSINLAPTLSYFFIPNRLQFGVGPILLFQSIRLNNGSRLKTTAYGGQLFLRGYVWNGLFLQARYDMVNKESYYKYPERINVSHLLIGGGYSTSISNVGRFYVSALIDVINDNESVYQGTFGDFPLMLMTGFEFSLCGRNRRQ